MLCKLNEEMAVDQTEDSPTLTQQQLVPHRGQFYLGSIANRSQLQLRSKFENSHHWGLDEPMAIPEGKEACRDEFGHCYELEQQVLEQSKQIQICGPCSEFG